MQPRTTFLRLTRSAAQARLVLGQVTRKNYHNNKPPLVSNTLQNTLHPRMSSESQPISAERFAFAIQDLPAENLYSKAHELENSIAHLERSNTTLQEYIDSIRTDPSLPEATRQEGDKDCSDAVSENQIVIERQRERINLLKREIERRGAKWHGVNPNGKVNGSSPEGTTHDSAPEPGPGAGGRFTDEELRQQMMDRLGDDDNGDDGDGMHL